MAKVGAPIGNKNAAGGKERMWNDALRRAIKQDSADRLRMAAEQLLTLASEGESWAIKELGDRLDGKAAQAVLIGNDEDKPFKVSGEWNLLPVKPNADSSDS